MLSDLNGEKSNLEVSFIIIYIEPYLLFCW